MTVNSPGQTTTNAQTSEALALADRSTRLSALTLFLGSALWIFAGCLLGLLASLKFHGPGMGSGSALTYGRVYPASIFALTMGGLAQAGIGLMVWLMIRQARGVLKGGGLAVFGGIVWNIGILAGIGAILSGNSTGFEGLEIPRGAAVTLLGAYLLIGLVVLKSFLQGPEGTSYVSGWFFIAALFWFPWILSTAILFLHVFPGRPAFQYVVGQWYAGNLTKVWLACIAYGIAFYFVPKLSQKPLHSRSMALLTFWLTLLFASWAVVPSGAPVPAWIPGVSTLASLVALVPVLAAVSNLKHSLSQGNPGKPTDPSLRCFQMSIPCLLVAGLLQAISAVRGVGEPVAFTFFGPGLQALFLGGFVGLNFLGAIIFALPRLGGGNSTQSGLVVTLAMVSVGLLSVPLILGGVLQGAAAQNALLPFNDSLNKAMHFLRLSTLGWLAAVGMSALWLMLVSSAVWQGVFAPLVASLTSFAENRKTSGVSA